MPRNATPKTATIQTKALAGKLELAATFLLFTLIPLELSGKKRMQFFKLFADHRDREHPQPGDAADLAEIPWRSSRTVTIIPSRNKTETYSRIKGVHDVGA